jgi:hypothetical protein
VKHRARLIATAAVALLLLGVAAVAHYAYFAPRQRLDAQLRTLRAETTALEDRLDGRRRVRQITERIAPTLLVAERDAVEHRFRTLLTRLGEQAGLEKVVVTQAEPQPRTNPAARAFPSSARRRFEQTPDFAVIRATVEGEGTLQQAVGALALLESQPWAHRVESVAFQPAGAQGARMTFRASVSTILAPDLARKDAPEPALAPVAPELEPAARLLAARDVFRPPPPPPAPAPPAVAQQPRPRPPAGPPPPTYADWRLTGVVLLRGQPEAWLLNTRSGERRVVRQGDRVLDAALVAGEGERAVFEIDGKQYEVTTGQTLDGRRPVG